MVSKAQVIYCIQLMLKIGTDKTESSHESGNTRQNYGSDLTR